MNYLQFKNGYLFTLYSRGAFKNSIQLPPSPLFSQRDIFKTPCPWWTCFRVAGLWPPDDPETRVTKILQKTHQGWRASLWSFEALSPLPPGTVRSFGVFLCTDKWTPPPASEPYHRPSKFFVQEDDPLSFHAVDGPMYSISPSPDGDIYNTISDNRHVELLRTSFKKSFNLSEACTFCKGWGIHPNWFPSISQLPGPIINYKTQVKI